MARTARLRSAVIAACAIVPMLAATLVAAPSAEAVMPGQPLLVCPGFSGLNSANTWQSLESGYVALTGHNVRILNSSTGAVSWTTRTYSDVASQTWLNSMKWIGDLLYTSAGRHAGVTAVQRQNALDLAVKIVHDYTVHNPAALTDRPTPGQKSSAGHRAEAIGCLIEALGPSRTPTWLSSYAHADAAWLASSKHWLGAWNQGLEQDLGILSITCVIGPSTLRNFATTRASNTMAVNIDSEGATTEQSIGYAGYGYALWNKVITTMGACGIAAPATAQRANLVPEFLAWATTPAGTFEQLGDTEYDPTPDIPGTAAEYAATQGDAGTPPNGRVRVYNTEGYVFGRSGWDNFRTSSYYSLRFGPTQTMHGHADKTSVTYWVGGRQILTDSGHIGYNNAAARTYLKSAAAHNEVSTPARLYLREGAGGANLVGQWQTGNADGYTIHDKSVGLMVHGRFTPYAKTRSVIVLRNPDIMLVSDIVAGGAAGQVWTQRWHLTPGAVAVSGSSMRATFSNGTSIITVPEMTSRGAKVSRSATWVGRHPNVRTTSYQALVTAVGRSASYMTIVAPHGAVSTSFDSVTHVLTVFYQGQQVAQVARSASGILSLVG